ncbi:MAG TPA: phosphatidylserine synthase [Campylobacterales bacterium]|nr:phosphatidylserine synthase [Campylobacterales bacterium]
MFRFLFERDSNFNLANLFTFTNIGAGVVAIYFISKGEYNLAVISAWIGGAFDIFDGKIARKFGLSSPFGIQLDSFADSLSFVIVPLLLLYFAIFQESSINPILFGIAFLFYTIAGLRRLINFNLNSDIGKVEKFFTGVPTPLGAILLWIVYLLWSSGIVENEIYILFYIAIVGYLLNSKIRIPHP